MSETIREVAKEFVEKWHNDNGWVPTDRTCIPGVDSFIAGANHALSQSSESDKEAFKEWYRPFKDKWLISQDSRYLQSWIACSALKNAKMKQLEDELSKRIRICGELTRLNTEFATERDKLREELRYHKAIYNPLIDGAARDTEKINKLQKERDDAVSWLERSSHLLKQSYSPLLADALEIDEFLANIEGKV